MSSICGKKSYDPGIQLLIKSDYRDFLSRSDCLQIKYISLEMKLMMEHNINFKRVSLVITTIQKCQIYDSCVVLDYPKHQIFVLKKYILGVNLSI